MQNTLPAASPKQKAGSLAALTALSLLIVSCEQPKVLDEEATSLKAQLSEIQKEESSVEDELLKLTRAHASTKENTIVRKAGGTIDQKNETMSAEVTALSDRKAHLEKEVSDLATLERSYRQKYL